MIALSNKTVVIVIFIIIIIVVVLDIVGYVSFSNDVIVVQIM